MNIIIFEKAIANHRFQHSVKHIEVFCL